jgi:transcriptional regulator with GAF, ATPase, and Fis domain
MKYLLYYVDGFIKKFPLKKRSLTIGRGQKNDLVMQDEHFSRQHLRVIPRDHDIVIKDLDSTNGTFVNQVRVKEAIIGIGDSFTLGGVEFVLKEGSIREFQAAKELLPIFRRMKNEREAHFKLSETRYIQDMYNETLKQILQHGLRQKDMTEFLHELSHSLSNLAVPGNFFVVSQEEDDISIILAVKKKAGMVKTLKQLLKEKSDVFFSRIPFTQIEKGGIAFSYFPITLGKEKGALVYLPGDTDSVQAEKMDQFLDILAQETGLLSQLFLDGEPVNASGKADETTEADQDSQEAEIVASSHTMRELVKQSRKIAKSDIFVLIQGESGTGKELFARLIHNNSLRHGHHFVAINCAAIPENLLESELFGYEKGAFTGAYTRQKGKLELASGGTLVLDEIGDMSLNLQSKLLRALQEHEFYRLGGSTPIKVDLRIISLTNRDIHLLIREKKIREDLYYRLAHHIISIPSLRERKEDITALINHFSSKFSRRLRKTIRGFSMKAFETMQAYHWPGNVRQLENEINRLVNLCDDNEMIGYELISDAVMEDKIVPVSLSGTEAPVESPTDERAHIISRLEQNDWNKSKTARQLKMTYQGLHKKMKRLGITRSESSQVQ